MKDSKRIDNKAKSRRIAAYALAGCMAITAAPITMPNMGAEVVEAAQIYELVNGRYTLELDDSRLSSNTTYAEVASKLYVNAEKPGEEMTMPGSYAVWAKGAKTVAIYDKDDNLLWNTSGDTSAPGTTKLGYGKTYKIKATFERTIGLAKDAEESNVIVTSEVESGNSVFIISGDSKSANMNSTTDVAFYPTSGMLKNEKDGDVYNYVDKDGHINDEKTGVYKNTEGWYLTVAGVANTKDVTPTVEKNSNGSWYIGKYGKVDFTKKGLVEAVEIGETGKTHTGLEAGLYYVENGKVNYNYTGLVQKDGSWFNVVKGKVEATKESTVVKAPNGKWIYIDPNGESNNYFDGLAKNSYGTWYIRNGIVDFTKEGPVTVADADGKENGEGAQTTYFLLGGKVQEKTTGILFYRNEPYYVEKGVVGEADFDDRTLAKDTQTGKWYVLSKNGNREWNFDGLVKNQYGTWYAQGGEVNFDKKGVVRVNEENREEWDDDDVVAEYYVEGGKVQTDKTGIIIIKSGWGATSVYNVKEGKLFGLDIDESVVKASDGNWYIFDEDGQQKWNGLGGNSYGIWIAGNKGYVDFKTTGFHQVTEEEAKLSGISEGDVVYIKDSKLQKDFTGLVTVDENDFHVDENRDGIDDITGVKWGDTIYVKNGVVCDDAGLKEATVVKASDGTWYYVDETGKINLDKEGIAKNSYGTWYVEGGIVRFNRTGFYTEDDVTYYFVDSKLAKDMNGLVKGSLINPGEDDPTGDVVKNVEKGIVTAVKASDRVVKFSDGSWYYVKEDGTVDETFTGVAENKNGVWYIDEGKVDFTKTGIVEIDGTDVQADSEKVDDLDDGSTLYVVNGKVQLSYSGFVVDKNKKVLFEKGQITQNDDPQLVKGTDGKWYYVYLGEVYDYTGLAKNSNGVWYVFEGVVSFTKTGIIETDAVESAKLDAGKYYVSNGKMTGDKEGIIKSGGTSYYVKKSAVVTGIEADERVIKVDGAWYCINEEGEVFTPDDGLAENENGVWFIKDGKVDFTKKALVEVASDNDSPTLDKKDAKGNSIYVSGGKFQDDVTCVYVGKDAEGNAEYTYVKKGVETNTDGDITVNTVVKGTDGKNYAVTPGITILQNGIAKNDDKEVVLVKDYVVDTKTTTTYKVQEGSDAEITDVAANKDILIVNGKFAKTTSGIVRVPKSEGTGYDRIHVQKGVCTATDGEDTLVKVDGDYWYVGTTSYTVQSIAGGVGLGKFGGDDYYVVGNKVSKKNGTVILDGVKYTLKDGEVTDQKDLVTGLIKDDESYKVVENDVLNKNVSGVYTLTTGAPAEGQIKIETNESAITSLNGQKVIINKGILKKATSDNQIVIVDGKAYKYASSGDYAVTALIGIHDGKIYDSGELQKAEAGKNKVVNCNSSDYIVNDAGEIQEATDSTTVYQAEEKFYLVDESGVVQTGTVDTTKVDGKINGVTKRYVYKDTKEIGLLSGLDDTKLYDEGVLQKATDEVQAYTVSGTTYIVDGNGDLKTEEAIGADEDGVLYHATAGTVSSSDTSAENSPSTIAGKLYLIKEGKVIVKASDAENDDVPDHSNYKFDTDGITVILKSE